MADRLPSDDAAVERFLMGRLNYERVGPRPGELRLEPMQRLAEALGNPHLAAPVIHLAGTKGKGSVAAMVASVLSAAGCRTGLYSSPHLVRIEERLRIDGQACTPGELTELVDAARPTIEAMDQCGQAPTFFELTTALAMLHFQRQRADWVVLETGLGGRLDSTNICQPVVSVITSISYDHTRQLGDTLPEIAAEKCGIIKPGRPVVSGVGEPSARRVVRETVEQRGCPYLELGEDFVAERVELRTEPRPLTVFDYGRGEQSLEQLRCGLLGEHQARNAALAVAAVQLAADESGASLSRLDESAIRRGLESVSWPARVELIAPRVVLDVAHNVASAEALAQVLGQCFPREGRRRLLFGTSSDKDPVGMLRCLAPQFDEIMLTRYVTNPRAVPPSHLAELAAPIAESEGIELRQQADPVAAWRTLLAESSPTDLICVAGSFFLAAELRDIMRDDLRP